MKELTKEQRQIIENKIKQEVENFNTFLDRQYCIDKIYKTIINRIKSHYDIGFDFLTIIEKNITEIDKISYEVIAIEEIKQILNIEDNIRYISGVFYIFGLSRTNLKTQVHGVVDILSLFETYPLVFDHCIFTQRIGYFNQITNIKKISFLNCEFEEQIYLNFQECLDIFQMDNCVFEDRVTIKGKFNDNVYFNNSIFKDYANFHTCEFEKTANFYGVRFEKTPNFSQVIFKGNLNAINAKLNFTFDDLQQRIKQECTSYESQRTTKKAGVIPNLYQEKSLDKFANDFRDSFRTFKNALIKDNNLLDASNFHKYELYCKEIELKQNWDKKGENVKNTTDLEKNVSRIRDFVDFLLLGFYRKLCDHHTDFLKVFNNLILLISLYILFIFVGSFEFDLEKKSIQNLNKTSDMFSYLTKVKEVIINFSFMQQYYNHILISFVAVCFICLIVIFYKIFKNIKLDFIIIKNIIFKDIIKSILILCVYLLFLLIILIYINIYIPKNQNNLNILSNIGIFFTFCIFYL
ncbi:pentapeptide repeat-containing protein, partial [Campylobacter jejuni]|nr:pentapeptide repeat-containing protein [Campylobacter jejuni]